MIRPDFHLHTTASDGVYSASQVARLAQRADVTAFSITDHDTLAALPAAADAAYDRGLVFIPGVEISTEGDEEIHILGYGVKADDAVLLAFFQQMAEERRQRFFAMARRLKDLGMPIDEALPSDAVSPGRPHLARALMEKGFVSSVQEAFERFLGKGCPAYIPREKLPASRAISLLRERDAVPVLAHPGLIGWPTERLLPMLTVWQDAGLMGLEVYHPANREDYPRWDRLARQRRLLVTGGSDFHDILPPHGQIGETIAAWPSAIEDAWALFRAARG